MTKRAQKVLLACIGCATLIALSVHFSVRWGAIANVYGHWIHTDDVSGTEGRQKNFATLVQSELTENLVRRFEIDSSDSAVVAFAQSKGLDLAAPGVAMADQQRATALADAIDAVLSGAESARGAYENYQMQSFSDFESWQRYLEEFGSTDTVDSLRTFAEQPVEQQLKEEISKLRPIYLASNIEKHICAKPSIEAAIRREMHNKLGDFNLADESAQAVWNYECRIEAREFLRNELADNVEVYDPALLGYESLVTFAR